MRIITFILPFILLLTINRPLHKIFIPHIEIPRQTNIGVESESAISEKWYKPGTLLKISIAVTDDIVNGDFTKPDKKLNGNKATWITVKNWIGTPVCELPNQSDIYRYADVINKLKERYKPEYIEIWNEPDVQISPSPDNFGCIGDGARYGEFVEKLYPFIADDNVKIIAGAVSDIRAPFVSDMLEEVKDNYDGLSFHCYEYFFEGYTTESCIEDYEYAETLTEKPVYLSETAVYYSQSATHDSVDFIALYENAQVRHFETLVDLPEPWFWYTIVFNGWPNVVIGCYKMNTDMIGKNICTGEFYPRPVWFVYMME